MSPLDVTGDAEERGSLSTSSTSRPLSKSSSSAWIGCSAAAESGSTREDSDCSGGTGGSFGGTLLLLSSLILEAFRFTAPEVAFAALVCRTRFIILQLVKGSVGKRGCD